MVMGVGLIMARVDKLQAPDQLTRAGFFPGLIAGLLVIIGNPKAILFHIGVLPGFFDLTRVTTLDIFGRGSGFGGCAVLWQCHFGGNV